MHTPSQMTGEDMRLIDLCTVFPSSDAFWPVAKPSRALPFEVRGRIHQWFGGVFAAADLNRRKAPTRTGIAIRPFEPGDPLGAISRAQLLKTGEVHTRVDSAPGRQRAVIVLHGYSQMTFKAEGQVANKGQLALGVGALIEAVHESLSHTCEIVCIKEAPLGEALAGLHAKLAMAHHSYIISDFLFDPKSRDAATLALHEGVLRSGAKRPFVFVIRDGLEWIENNPLQFEAQKMLPYSAGQSHLPARFSGADYIDNLRAQFERLNSVVASDLSGHLEAVTPASEVEATLEAILTHLQRKPRR